MKRKIDCDQWRIQDFPEEGALTPKGRPTYYLANLFQKLHENEEILGQRGARVPRAPLRSATGDPILLDIVKLVVMK